MVRINANFIAAIINTNITDFININQHNHAFKETLR